MTAVETRSAAFEQVARPPVREPEDERDPQRAHERSGEDGVDRAHVRNDGPSPETGKLARERGFEARTAQRSVPGSERADAAVVGKHARDGAVREHDDLVDECGERADLGHGRGERRMTRIDLLRDEDELAH